MHYFFGDEFYLKSFDEQKSEVSFKHFSELFINSYKHESQGQIHIIRGRAGVEKTQFFKRGVQYLIRSEGEIKKEYIPLGVDFKNIDCGKNIKFYIDSIYEILEENAKDAIKMLGRETYIKFKEENKYLYSDDDIPWSKLFPNMFFCREIYNTYNQPCIIVFDNIDLADMETQINVFKATANVCQKLKDIMSHNKLGNKYCIYYVTRPETKVQTGEFRIGEVINFPLPNVLNICLSIIKDVIFNIAKKFDEQEKIKCEVECYDIVENKKVSLTTYFDVATYFNNILEYYLRNLWDLDNDIINRLGTSEDFHCNIVNYNVRAFLSFFADTLSNGGFKPFTKEFNETMYFGNYTVFNYIEMLICGKWLVHPGNKLIDPEGGNKAPIVFNIFDTSIWNDNQTVKVRHFMLYIRILQYFTLCSYGEEIFYSDFKKKLCSFFDEEYILKATKKLIYVRILYSLSEGDTNIVSKQHWKHVVVEDTTRLSLSPTGKFYIEKLICEFEYLYQMALSSLMPIKYVDELKNNNNWKYEKELTVLRFLDGVFLILKKNLDSYDEDTLRSFKELFSQDNENGCKPFRRMLSAFIEVMRRKVKRAENNELTSSSKLRNILEVASELEHKATYYFESKLGEEIFV